MKNFRAKAKTPEGQVKKEILELLKWIPKCSVFPISTTGIFDPRTNKFRKSTMRLGTPDILICIQGDFVGIEVKAEKGVLSTHQKHVLEHITDCGGHALIARSADDVKEFLTKNGYLS